jgi:hypothetical protein
MRLCSAPKQPEGPLPGIITLSPDKHRRSRLTSLRLALLTALLLACACHGRPFPGRRSIELRSDLKPAKIPHMAAHTFARYSGELRFIKSSMSVRAVHVPGCFETCVRVYVGPENEHVALVATVHKAQRSYYQELAKQLAPYPRVLYEDLRGSRRLFAKDKAPISKQLSTARWTTQQQLFKAQGRSKKGWRPADLPLEDVLRHLKAVNITSPEKTWSGPDNSTTNRRELFHLLGLSLVQIQTGSSAPELLPRGLYKLSAADFISRRPWSVENADYGLIYRRNDFVLRELIKELEQGHKRVALLYGAAHCFDLQDRLLERGFKLHTESWIEDWNLNSK